MHIICAYIIYLTCSIITVFAVGGILHRNGKTYLFGECPDKAMAYSANNFLYTGYCMLNTGFALFFLRSAASVDSFEQVLEFIISSQGTIFISLGIMHFINVIFAPRVIMYFIRKKLLTHKKQ
jgi:hypothetical protein